MSQIYKTTSPGPVPPAVPTSFKTDITDAFNFNVGSGTSVPIANVEQIYGDNGIQTSTNSTTGNVIQVRFSRGTVATVSNETVTALSFATNNDTTVTMNILISGFCASLGQGIGGNAVATIVNVAGVATLIDETDFNLNKNAGLIDANVTVDTSGNLFRIRVTGSLGNPISWTVCTPGQVST